MIRKRITSVLSVTFLSICLVKLGGCVTTTLEYGPLRYASGKDWTVKGLYYKKDSNGEEFKAEEINTNASNPAAIQAATIEKMADKLIQLAPKP